AASVCPITASAETSHHDMGRNAPSRPSKPSSTSSLYRRRNGPNSGSVSPWPGAGDWPSIDATGIRSAHANFEEVLHVRKVGQRRPSDFGYVEQALVPKLDLQE
ncbi:MAG: hypothetical protein JWR85_1317, partial [Marmoricola sp.]|nr:hypothetical protein [Marmoricola sp.]